jgi:hypothetical protein
LVLSYQGLEEENFDQKLPGPPGWGLMQRVSSSLITKKQNMLKKPNKEWCLGSGRWRQLSQDRTARYLQGNATSYKLYLVNK